MTDLVADLRDHMDESLEPENLAREREGFRIDNDGAADWALRKLAVIEKRMADADALADEEIQRVQEWLAQKRDEYERDRAWFDEQLEDYHRRVLEEDGKRKTIKLPAGTLHARKLPDNVEIADVDAFVAWARGEREDFIRTSYAVDKAALKQAVLKDGEAIDGVTKVDGETTFKVEVRND